MTGAQRGASPVGGATRSRAPARQRVLPGRGQIWAAETTTANGSEGAKHANTEAVALSAVPCRSYQPMGTAASQSFQNWPQYGAASATLPSNAFFYFFWDDKNTYMYGDDRHKNYPSLKY